MNVLDLLLKTDVQDLPTKEIKQKRLSAVCGSPVIFKIRALPFDRVAEIKGTVRAEDMPLHIILSGTVEPDLKSKELIAKFGVETPLALLKKMLLPGEIDDISGEIEKLSGYRITTIEEIKKK